jgi:predicted DNA-binding transcriptional regulator AlpA
MEPNSPRLLDKEDIAAQLKRSPQSVYMAVYRRNEDLVPMPMMIGRKMYWTQKSVDVWIAAQAATKTVQPEQPTLKRGPGRPRKGEKRAQVGA